MRPFDFIITFFSFVYSLGLTHILFSATRMIRQGRGLIFSWPLALWMASALLMLVCNWLSFWDMHQMQSLSIWTILAGFVLVVQMYVICALLAPDVGGADGLDMPAFYDRYRVAILGSFLVMMGFAFVANLAAGMVMGVSNWSDQNLLVVGMTLVLIPPLITRRAWVQVAAAVLLFAAQLYFIVHYYPVLK